MIDTLPAQIGAAATALVLVLVLLRGGAPERIGAAAFLIAWGASLLLQDEARLHGPQWGLMTVDAALLAAFAALAWKSRRAWPVWACALQTLIVASHILPLIDLRPPLRAVYAVINLCSYGIVLALALGALAAWREDGDHRRLDR